MEKSRKISKILRILIALTLLVCIVGAGLLIVKKKKEQLAKTPPPELLPLPVRTSSVKSGHLAEIRRYTGILEAKISARISPRITAQTIEVRVREGDVVGRGQVLVLLDSRVQRANIKSLKAQLEAARSSLYTYKNIYERDSALYRSKALSKEALDRSKAVYDGAKAKVTELENSLKSAEVELSYTKLCAPFDGVITKRLIEPGDTVVVGKSVLIVEATDAGYKLTVKVPQAIFAILKKNTPVQILPPPGQESPPLHVTISRLYPADALEGTLMPNCEIDLAEKPYGLPPGATLHVLFRLKDFSGLIVPARSLLEQGIGQPLVYTITDNNRVHIVPVQLLLRNTDFVCVKGQLQPEARVIVAGEDVLIRLHEGDKVSPVEIPSDRRL